MGTKREKVIYDGLAELYAELEWEWTLSQAPPDPVSKSEQFQKRMEELFCWSRRREAVRKIIRKAACFFLLAVVGAGALLLANEEVRAEVIRFFRKGLWRRTVGRENYLG